MQGQRHCSSLQMKHWTVTGLSWRNQGHLKRQHKVKCQERKRSQAACYPSLWLLKKLHLATNTNAASGMLMSFARCLRAEGVEAKSCLAVLNDWITAICNQVLALHLPVPHFPTANIPEGDPEHRVGEGGCYSGHPEAMCVEPGAADPWHALGHSVLGHQLLRPWQAHFPSAAQPPHSHTKWVSTREVPHWPHPAPLHQLILYTGFCSCSFQGQCRLWRAYWLLYSSPH